MSISDLFEAILGGVEQSSRGRSQMPVDHPAAEPLPEFTGGGSDVMNCVVQVVALKRGRMGGMGPAWTGSGTIVHPAGLILTNCHVANPRAMGMSSPPAERMGIAMTERSDAPPALSYFAEVVTYDPALDLAVMRIVADVNGRRLRNLNLPAIGLGDSDDLRLGERVSIFGYPGIGGETITFTSGNVSGFSREDGIRDNRAWIKTDATISGGNSGGTAVNDAGHLIGIPTQAAAGAGITPVDARPVLDTNRDGRINERDTPMAIGGFINGLRPVKLAVPLLEKSGMKVRFDATPAPQLEREPEPNREFSFDFNQGTPAKQEFSELMFSLRVLDDGRPVHPTRRIPSGVHTVYASFEFTDMQQGTPWSTVWMSGEQEIIRQNNTWDDGPNGRKAVKISNKNGVPDGEYHLVLGIGSEIALEGDMIVGTPVDETDSEVSGTLVDGATGRAIAGGLVVVLKPEADLHHFMQRRDAESVFSSVESDAQGRFVLPQQLPKGQAYSLIVAARGYEPLTVARALRIGETAPEHANIGQIKLTNT